MLQSSWVSKIRVWYLFFQKLESLKLVAMSTCHKALQKFCATMPHITRLCLPDMYHKKRNDGVLRAIASNLHHLKYLDISYSDVDSKSIEYLLPTDDNALGGCPELVDLDLSHVIRVDVKLLKKIILALPKLRSLKHELLVNALGVLTEEEMGLDTARYLTRLYARNVYKVSRRCPINFDILAKSPAFRRLNNSITTVDFGPPTGKEGQERSALLADILMLLPKLKDLRLCGISEAHDHVSTLLESIGDRLEYVDFPCFSGNLSVQDIIMTCNNLVRLTMIHAHGLNDFLINGNITLQDQKEKPSKLPVLNYLKEIVLDGMDQELCNADMLIALLQSPCLNKIHIIKVAAMSDDVMFNALTSRGCAALSKVTDFSVEGCPLITAAPFVHWLHRDNCSLGHMKITKCEKMDYHALRDAAEEYPRALNIEGEL